MLPAEKVIQNQVIYICMRTPGKDSSITPRGILRLGNSERDGKENEERRSVRFAEQHETKRFRYQFSE